MAKKMRIDKVLSNIGYGSRTEVNISCKRGMVVVNGEVVKKSSTQVDPENDEILFNGEKINYREFIYLIMNKPAGCISATTDKWDQTVIDLLDREQIAFDPFPVGRLDKDTEGLLVITNDGKLSHRLLSPKKHVPKTYFAEIDGVVTNEDIEAFKEGVVLDDGYKTLPGELEILKSDDISEINLTIHEGKFHQVKRMFESVGKKVVYLKRIQMGKLKLDESLELGEFRELTKEELELLETK